MKNNSKISQLVSPSRIVRDGVSRAIKLPHKLLSDTLIIGDVNNNFHPFSACLPELLSN